jgi:hypothetical protein
MSCVISLTPGFSPVTTGNECQNRFNGFHGAYKPLKRLAGPGVLITRLKPGVNESKHKGVHIFARINGHPNRPVT